MFYLNGQLIDEEIALSIRDRGFLLGDGLFETILCVKGVCIALANHWHRLCSGAKYLNIPIRFSLTDISQAIVQLLQKNDLMSVQSAIRITLTRGVGPRGLSTAHLKQPTLLITCEKYKAPTQTAIRLSFTPNFANKYCPLHQFKTLNYLDKITAKQEAAKKGYDDALLLNSKHCIVGTSCANIFFMYHGILLTPAISSGCLPGITRDYVLALAKQMKLKRLQKQLPYEQTSNYDAAFVTNSLIGIMPVSQIDQINFDIEHSLIKTLKQRYDERLENLSS